MNYATKHIPTGTAGAIERDSTGEGRKGFFLTHSIGGQHKIFLGEYKFAADRIMRTYFPQWENPFRQEI